MDLRDLTSLTDQTIVKGLENVPGVASIDVNGRITRQILIQIKPSALTALGISVDQVAAAIRAANQDVPAGRITHGQSDSIVRVEGKIKDPAQFGRIIVAMQGGAPVYLSQVADVIDGEKEPDSIARINGRRSITLDLKKSQDANMVDTGHGVAEAVALLKARLPAEVELRIVNSVADQVERSVNRVKSTIIEGALLTVLIVFLFLHSWRSTIITGLTLPIAVIATFIALYAFGFTLNFLTLMALSLCIGLLIDDAIVVRENIVRHLGLGKDHVTAAREGTDEIGLAVMATTFAIVAVFVPIAFMSGIVGKFFFQFGLTVAVAVLVSLFVSFTLDPMLSSIWHDPPGQRFRRVPWLGRFMDRVEHVIERVHVLYGTILEWALTHRKSVIAIAILSFFSSFAVLPLVGTEFIPDADQGFISLRLNTPVGSSLEYTDSKVRQVEATLKDVPEVALAITTIGTEEGRNYARLNLKLTDRAERRRSQKELEQAIRAMLKPIPGIELAFGYDRPVWVNLLGPDPETLTQLINEFAVKVAEVKGIADLETSEKALAPALSIRLNNDAAADLGINVQQVGATVRPLLAGDTVSYWLAPDGNNYEVNVQLPKDSRRLSADLGNLYLTTGKQGPDGEARMVPLRQVAEIVESTSPQIIKRQELQRRVALYANAEGRPSGDVNSDVQKIIKATVLPPGYRFDVGGQAKDMQESFVALIAARGHGDNLHLPHPGVAVRELHAAHRDHDVAAVHADRRVPRAAPDRHDAQHVLDDRLRHADGARHQERDPAGRLRQPRAARRREPARFAAAGRPGAAAPDPDDDRGDDRRDDAAGVGNRRGRRNAGADGPRDHRRRHHVDTAHAGRGAGPVHVSRPLGRMAQGEKGGAGRRWRRWRRRLRRCPGPARPPTEAVAIFRKAARG